MVVLGDAVVDVEARIAPRAGQQGALVRDAVAVELLGNSGQAVAEGL